DVALRVAVDPEVAHRRAEAPHLTGGGPPDQRAAHPAVRDDAHVELHQPVLARRVRRGEVPPQARPVRRLDADVLTGDVLHLRLRLDPDDRGVPVDPLVVDHVTGPPSGRVVVRGAFLHGAGHDLVGLRPGLVDLVGPLDGGELAHRGTQGHAEGVEVLVTYAELAVVL